MPTEDVLGEGLFVPEEGTLVLQLKAKECQGQTTTTRSWQRDNKKTNKQQKKMISESPKELEKE